METLTKNVNELSASELQELFIKKQKEENELNNKKRQDYEDLKEDTILNLVAGAKAVHDSISEFKDKAFADIEAIHDLLKIYSKRHADSKGNFSLENKAGDMRIKYSRQELGYFDERSEMAEKHIIEFINKEFADTKIKKLVLLALERKKGALDIKQVQKLYSMENDFDDDNWKEGIKLLKESWTPSGSKPYITFYVKVKNEWKLINLNFANI